VFTKKLIERVSKLSELSGLVIIPDVSIPPLGVGKAPEDAGHRAVALYGEEVRISGTELNGVTIKLSFIALVSAMLAFDRACLAFEGLQVPGEKPEDRIYSYSDDYAKKDGGPERKALRFDCVRAEILAVMTNEMFLSLYYGRPLDDEYHRLSANLTKVGLKPDKSV